MSTTASASHTFPTAELDRRFYAFALDRLLAWSVYGGAVWAAWVLLLDDGAVAAGVAVVVATVLAVTVVLAVVLGLLGTSPGKAAVGLRVVDDTTGAPIGVGPALLRTTVLGVATLPTFGIGVGALAWTALMDRGRRRRGWHDHRARSVVLDVRPAPTAEESAPERPPEIVNLTAMRLLPAPPLPLREVPGHGRRSRWAAGPTTEVDGPAATPVTAKGLLGRADGTPTPGPSDEVTPAAPATDVPADLRARWRVDFDTGDEFVVDGFTLVGRNPEPRPGEAVKRLLVLPSTDLSLSKTHAQFQVVPDGALVVMDRGSTNGSLLVRGGVTRELAAGKPAALRDGDVVRFGDRQMRVARER